MSPSRFEKLSAAAQVYGERSFDNYAQIRSTAEALRDGFCEWLDSSTKCVFLVPPQGAFQAQNYGSGAFSVSGQGFLPLEPLSFGLAVKVSKEGDFMRLVMTCRKEGDKMYVQVEDKRPAALSLPLDDDSLATFFQHLYQHLMDWFEGRVEQYDNGSYGTNDIGFDIQRVES